MTFLKEPILTLSLAVNELPSLHLLFQDRRQLEIWKRAFLELDVPYPSNPAAQEFKNDPSGRNKDDDFGNSQ